MNDHIKIELAQAQDAAAIAQVHYAAVHQTARSFYSEEIIHSWSHPISNDRVERIKQVVEDSDEWMIVARQNNQIIGFGSIISKDNELRALYVHPSFGRCGVGTRILNVLEHEARSLELPYLQMDASINAETKACSMDYFQCDRIRIMLFTNDLSKRNLWNKFLMKRSLFGVGGTAQKTFSVA